MDAITNEKPKVNQRRRALMGSAIAAIIVFVMWNLPVFSIVLYPLRLFVTYVHEAGHSLGALLTGGEIRGFLVSPDGSGLAVTAGGNRAVVISAGYLGAALFGSGLFYLSNRFPQLDRAFAIALGWFMIGFTLLFARPDESGAITAIVIGVLFGLVLVVFGTRAPTFGVLLLLNVLALSTALNAVLDIYFLISNISATRGEISNDAVAFSRDITNGLVPATVVAIAWALMAVAMLGAAVFYGVLRPLRAEVNQAYSQLRGN